MVVAPEGGCYNGARDKDYILVRRMGLKVGEVKLEKWTSKWREGFEDEKRNLQSVFGELALDIQHIGSTSVEGLDAKPIVDIAIGLNDLSDFEKVRQKFESLVDYSVKVEDNNPGEILIRKGTEENRTHFIHIMKQNSKEMCEVIKFRNILRTDPGVREQYSQLKRELAKKFPYDRKKYTVSKSDFIKVHVR